ncbi:hypothetical protein TCON_1583 [Astathelohania contejeani]|uniref:Uncharacterized protein n=1 Tax=Astathelohania contejeani TaxID=164912 RepID=A0ABQ7HYE4_9MICR|nr:hypothetical protein TCON_1583 [Thelohania contejeani]
MENERFEIWVDRRIRTDILLKIIDQIYLFRIKRKNEIILVEVGITSQDNRHIVEIETKRKYNFLANVLCLLCKAKIKIIIYVMTWDEVVIKYHRNYLKELNIITTIEDYI